LFDEPLSEQLCELLADIFPESLHVRVLAQGGAADATVWDLARTHDCLVVSKDEDFNRLAVVGGRSPKLVWVRRGNCATDEGHVKDSSPWQEADLPRWGQSPDRTAL
jgi:predicted nuclease of predicted toxin-antitoxin system